MNPIRPLIACTLLTVTGCGELLGSDPGYKNQLVADLTFDGPAEFDNPVSANDVGYFSGNWAVKDGAYVQDQASTNNFISIRRYTGAAWGSKGEAPKEYKVEVDMMAYKDADSMQLLGYPVGILSFIPYYRDPKHYVVAVATPTSTGGTKVECWAVNGFSPGGEAWPQEAMLMSKWLSSPLATGSNLNLGAQVDTKNQTLRLTINGEAQEPMTTPLITQDRHWVALVSNGNYVQFDNMKLYK
jgi:hypothetical protein